MADAVPNPPSTDMTKSKASPDITNTRLYRFKQTTRKLIFQYRAHDRFIYLLTLPIEFFYPQRCTAVYLALTTFRRLFYTAYILAAGIFYSDLIWDKEKREHITTGKGMWEATLDAATVGLGCPWQDVKLVLGNIGGRNMLRTIVPTSDAARGLAEGDMEWFARIAAVENLVAAMGERYTGWLAELRCEADEKTPVDLVLKMYSI